MIVSTIIAGSWNEGSTSDSAQVGTNARPAPYEVEQLHAFPDDVLT